MSTSFKKGWYLGKPLRELQPNTKYFRFWYLGKLYPLFDKPAVPSTSITVQITEVLHLSASLALYTPAVYWGYNVSISEIQHLVLLSYDCVARAGFVGDVEVSGTIAEVLYNPPEERRVAGTNVSIIYSPPPSGTVTNLVPQVEYTETVIEIDQAGVTVVYENEAAIEIDQAGVTVVYENEAAIEIDQAGVVIVYNQDGIFLVNLISLTLTLQAPTIIAIEMGELDLQSLTLSLHAPYVYISYNVSTTVVQKHLTFSQFSPSVRQGCAVEVSFISLYLTVHEPLALIGAMISETLEALLTLYSPTINLSSRIAVSKLALRFTLRVPTINFNGLALVSTPLSLLFEIYTPAMRGGVNLEETLSLHLSLSLAPTVAWGFVVVISAAKHLVLSIKAVTARVTSNAICLPPLQSLELSLFEVEALTGVSIKETQSLVLNTLGLEILTSSITIVSTLHLVLQKYSPAVRISTYNPVDLQSLILNLYGVGVVLGYVIKETFVLHLSIYEVTICYGASMTPDTLSLYLTLYDPDILALPFEPYDTDPLHKERQWGSSYDLGEGEYASRSGSSLSSRFPLQSGDVDRQITVCCWVRFKSFPSRQCIFDKLTSNGTPSVISLGLHTLGDNLELMWGNSSSGTQVLPGMVFNDITLMTGRWYHIGLAVDGVERTVYLQVWDDKAKTTRSVRWTTDAFGVYPASTLYIGNGEFRVGHVNVPYSGDLWLDGYLDELVVFNKLKSPYEMDQIRKGQFNGPSQGQTVGDFGLMAGYDPQGKITVADYATAVGYSPAGNITIADYGVMIGYRVEVPPPPSRFPVISGFPSPGTGASTYTFCNVTYKFKSDIFSYELGTNSEARASQFTLPVRELETMIGIADESSYLRLSETLAAGATIYSVPMWAFRTLLTSNAHAADLEFVAEDVSNIYVGEKVLLVRANDATIYDLCDVTSIAGNTVHVETPLTLHHHKFQMPTTEVRYDERSCYVVPCITGFVDAQDVELKGSRATWFLKVRVNGGAWINAGLPSIVDYMEAPAEAGYISPKVERTIVGTENGLMEMIPHMLTSKLAFQVEWYFIDDSWKILRNHFIAAKGKATSVPMPTWCFELRVLNHRDPGNTTIQLTPGFYQIWTRFTRLLVYPITGETPFVLNLSAHLGGDVYSCSAIESELHIGDKITLYPNVRFMEDELTFEFLYYNQCKVKASFIEVVD